MSQKRPREGRDVEGDTRLETAPAPPPPGALPEEEEEESSLLDSDDLSFDDPPPAPRRSSTPSPPLQPPSPSLEPPPSPPPRSTFAIPNPLAPDIPVVGQNFVIDESLPDADFQIDGDACDDDGDDDDSAGGRGGRRKKKKETKFWAHPIGLTLNPLQPEILIVFEREVPLHITPTFQQQRYFFMPLEPVSAGLWNVLCEYRFPRKYLRSWNLTAAFARKLGQRRVPTPLKLLPVRGFQPYQTALMEDIEVKGERVFATPDQRKLQLRVSGDSRALSVSMVRRALASSLSPLAAAHPQWTEPVPQTPLFESLGLVGLRLVTLDRLLEVLGILHGHRLVNRLAGLHRRHINSQRKTIYPKPARPLKDKDKAFMRALYVALPQEQTNHGMERSRPGTLLNKWTRPVVQRALRQASKQQKAGHDQLRLLRALDHDKDDLKFVPIEPAEAHRLLHSVNMPLTPPVHRERFFLGAMSAQLGSSARRIEDVSGLTDEELRLIQTLIQRNVTTEWLRETPSLTLYHALRKAGGYGVLVPRDTSDVAPYLTILDALVVKALVHKPGRFLPQTPRIAYHVSWRQLLYAIVTTVNPEWHVDLSEEGMLRTLWYGGPSVRQYARDFSERILMAHDFLACVPGGDSRPAIRLLSWGATPQAPQYFMLNYLPPFLAYRQHLADVTNGFHPEVNAVALQIPLQPVLFFQQVLALRALRAMDAGHLGRTVMTPHDLDAEAALRSMRAHIRDALYGQAWSVCVIHPTNAYAPFTRSAYERAFAPEALRRRPGEGDDALSEDDDDLGLDASSDDEEEETPVSNTETQHLCYPLGATVPAHQQREVYVVNLEAFTAPELQKLAQWLTRSPAERVVLHYRSGAYFQPTGDPVGLAYQVLERDGDLTEHLNSHASSTLVQQRWTRQLVSRTVCSIARGRAQLLGVPLGKTVPIPPTAKELTLAAVQEPYLEGLRPRRPHEKAREARVYWVPWPVLQQFNAAAWGMLYASEVRLIVREVPVEYDDDEKLCGALDAMYRESNAATEGRAGGAHPLIAMRAFALDRELVDAGRLERSFRA